MILLPIVIMTMPAGDDRDYMEQIYRSCKRLMYSTAWKYSRDKTTVDDVVSDSCISLIKNIPTLRTLADKKLKAYIVTTVRNTALNYYDRQRRTLSHMSENGSETLENVADTFDVEKTVALNDELDGVWKAIEQLPPKEQQVMYLKYKQNLTDDEIAAKVGISAVSVRKYVSRARERLKKTLYME